MKYTKAMACTLKTGGCMVCELHINKVAIK